MSDFFGTMDDTLTNEEIDFIVNNVERLKTKPLYGSPDHQLDCVWMRDIIKRLVEEHLFLIGRIKESCFLEK